ncbi:hypothetical protein [Streptomyces sp. NPDC101455]|uniref:hypothetical protein n=1 Tax=Streptomyces sp. NPDC101455 TaxID=3366142 RepID=UPI0038299E3C
MLWVGTPTRTLIEVGLEPETTVVHDILAGSPVSGLGATAAGELVVAGARGELRTPTVFAPEADRESARASVEEPYSVRGCQSLG